MAPGGGQVGGDVIDHQSAKHLLDSIGKIVHKEVKKEAQKRSNGDLKGSLTSVTLLGESVGFSDPCKLINDKVVKLIDARGDPCKKDTNGNDVDRFSDKQGAECNKSKIKDSDKKNKGGACAPYRRLHVCDKNMEKIATSMTKHDLLLDVCLAAKYEGDSLKHYSEKLNVTYTDSPSQLCTELARSFADIGDIVRGKDLYLGGNTKEKKKREDLEKNLKNIFENITKGNTELSTLPIEKVREYWWELNRKEVWKAITCEANGTYFHATCGRGRDATLTQNNCRCGDGKKPGTNADNPNTDPPTYFDYVPQYLRWFEEWAEDFCRKKKKKLENVKKQCRGDNGTDRYCSRNGFDCEKTVNARGKVRMGKGCTDCFFACYPYVDWIENQRKQFDKQKKIYDKEIKKYKNGASVSSNRRQKRDAGGTTKYEGYEKIFYKKLQETEYKDVGKFLQLLNEEKACKEVKDSEGGTIHFETVGTTTTIGENGGTSGTSGTNDKNEGTFYRSKYCQPCPDCGMKKNNNGEWEHKKNGNCTRGNLYKPIDNAKPTPIKILKSGENQKEIENKLNEFCDENKNDTPNSNGNSVASGSADHGDEKKSDKDSLYEEWKCYKGEDVQKVGQDDDDEQDYENMKNAGGLCILPNPKKNKEESRSNPQNEPEQFQKTYNDFFNFWVAHMLKDSIHWKKKLQRCLQNGNPMKCKDKCKGDCKCFESWVEQKKEKEWNPIKQHFYQQKDIVKKGPIVFTHDGVLEGVLKLEFYKDNSENNSEENSKNSLDEEEAEELKHIREIIEKKNQGEEAGG
ncbi:erythorcyte membrane protein, partial [Plasmodium falciparum Tanzania (2000708)]